MKKLFLLLAALTAFTLATRADVPPAEKILPDDTLFMFTVPNFNHTREISRQSPMTRLWQDPAMRPFADKFINKLDTQIIGPLEQDLGTGLSNYTALAQGQLTFAIVQNGWQGDTNSLPAWLFLIDTKDKSAQLQDNLAGIKHKWSDAGKPIKTEKIRDIEFTVLMLSSNDIPAGLKKFSQNQTHSFGDSASAEDPGATSTPPPQPVPLYLGQSGALFIAGNSPVVIEKVLALLSGGSVPALAEQPAFAADAGRLHDATAFGWINTKTLLDLAVKQLTAEAERDADKPTPIPFRPEKIITATGLTALRSVAFISRASSEGSSFEVFMAVPEEERQGFVKLLAGEAKDATPPPFIPADAVKFSRWRFSGPKAWDTLETTLNDISPQLGAGLNFALASITASAQQKNPDFDAKRDIIGNFGDDIVAYQKGPRSQALADIAAPPSIFLISSPAPDKLLESLKSVLGMLSRRGDPPSDRDFLGHKIYSVPMGPAPLANGQATGNRSLNLATGDGYLAISMDSAMLEEFLRSGDSPGKPLRGIPGLADAMQKVIGGGNSSFGYENQRETMRTIFAVLKQLDGATNTPVAPTSMMGLLQSKQFLRDWADVSLLPDYSLVAKYFYFAVRAVNATPDGLSLKVYAPAPPDLNK
jgi:hypothetical protein